MTSLIAIIKQTPPLTDSSSIISILTLVEEDETVLKRDLTAKAINLTCECSKKLNYKMNLLDSRREQIKMIRILGNSKIDYLSLDVKARIALWSCSDAEMATNSCTISSTSTDIDFNTKFVSMKSDPVARLTSIIFQNSIQLEMLDRHIQSLLDLAKEGSSLLDDIIDSKRISVTRVVELPVGCVDSTSRDPNNNLQLSSIFLVALVSAAIKSITQALGVVFREI